MSDIETKQEWKNVTETEFDDATERAYIAGMRRVWLRQLHDALFNLGIRPVDDDPNSKRAHWELERGEAIEQLQALCEDFGDTDWSPTLYLGDAIEKHLGRHLYVKRQQVVTGEIVDAGMVEQWIDDFERKYNIVFVPTVAEEKFASMFPNEDTRGDFLVYLAGRINERLAGGR